MPSKIKVSATYLIFLVALFSHFGALASVPSYYIDLARKHSIPVNVVHALAKTETNTKMNNGEMMPWPYVINYKGNPEYFATMEQMVVRAEQLERQGKLKFDIGLFQVNWYWNGRHRAKSIRELAHPTRNGEVAMEILLEHYNRTGNWIEAAGRYHNPANKNGLADIYKARFITLL